MEEIIQPKNEELEYVDDGITYKIIRRHAVITYVRDDVSDKTLLMYGLPKENGINEGIWTGPGGKIEKGQTPRQAATLETFQETNLKVEEKDWVHKGRLHNIMTKIDGDVHEVQIWTCEIYTTNKFSGKLKKVDREGELFWVPNKAFLEDDMFGMRECDKRYIQNLKNSKKVYVATTTTEDVKKPEEARYTISEHIIDNPQSSSKAYSGQSIKDVINIRHLNLRIIEHLPDKLKESAKRYITDNGNIDEQQKYLEEQMINISEVCFRGKSVVNKMNGKKEKSKVELLSRMKETTVF